MSSWRYVTEIGLASSLHANPVKYLDVKTARFLKIEKSALVLGSSQDRAQFEATSIAQPDLEIVVRRSGGGVVFLEPFRQLWVDISIPKFDRLYIDDVQKSFFPIGSIFLDVLSKICSYEFEMHTGNLVGGPIGKEICFAGIGPGEITFEGAKVVGISQRRTANGSVFQCTLYSRYPSVEVENIMGSVLESLPIPGYALGIAEIVNEFSQLPDAEIVSILETEFIRSLEEN